MSESITQNDVLARFQLLNLSFSWNSKLQIFTLQQGGLSSSNLKDPFSVLVHSRIFSIIKEIQSNSGLKRNSCVLYLMLLIICVVGFSLAFILILNKIRLLGNLLLIITPMLGYFLTIGRGLLREDIQSTLRTYLDSKIYDFQQILREFRASMSYSVSIGF